ncbi:MAG TPA: geranylgeranylglycerol-phosphate geranylgeranyltransferase [Rhodothermales bacterium]|nr:geranylgeranylglycerol-phosphate geranylgeranyltransferase [Rhodothermales bacterium]
MGVLIARPEANLWARRAWAVVCLLRPLNVVMIGLGVALGGVLAGGDGVLKGDPGFQLARLVGSAMLVGAGANTLNDVFDLRIDLRNRPHRPLPSGLVSVRMARGIGVAGSGLGVVLAATVSLGHLALALGVVGLLMIYNVSLKRIAFVGNLIVALVLGLALAYGGWEIGPLGPVLVGAVFAFLTTLAREIAKDVEDAEGDAMVGARTLPVIYGPDAALRIVLVILIVTLLLTPLPYFLLDFVGLYLVVILVTDALLLRACWLLSAAHPEVHARRISNVLKSAMATGMVALALGALVQLG